jgi:hypothetical protein
MEITCFMTLWRMAQEWSMRYRLVDGQGNFDLLTATTRSNALYRGQNANNFRRNTGDIERKPLIFN